MRVVRFDDIKTDLAKMWPRDFAEVTRGNELEKEGVAGGHDCLFKTISKSLVVLFGDVSALEPSMETRSNSRKRYMNDAVRFNESRTSRDTNHVVPTSP